MRDFAEPPKGLAALQAPTELRSRSHAPARKLADFLPSLNLNVLNDCLGDWSLLPCAM